MTVVSEKPYSFYVSR